MNMRNYINLIESISTEQSDINLVTKSWKNIVKVKNPNEAVQLAAVKKSGEVLQLLFQMGIEPSERVKIAAMQKTGYAFRHLVGKKPGPSEAVTIAALGSYDIINLIRYWTPSIEQAAQKLYPEHHNRSVKSRKLLDKISSGYQPTLEEIQIIYSIIGEGIFKKIKHFTQDQEIYLVNENPKYIKYFPNASDDLKKMAISSPLLWLDIKVLEPILNDSSEDVKTYAVSKYPYLIRYISDPSVGLQMTAVREDGTEIKNIKNPSVMVQMTAIKQNLASYNYIDNPSP